MTNEADDLMPVEHDITIKRLFNKDILLKHRNTNDFTGGMIRVHDDQDSSDVKYFEVVLASDGCQDVQVGDIVMLPWPRVMPPFMLNDERYTITSEDEVWAILDYDEE